MLSWANNTILCHTNNNNNINRSGLVVEGSKDNETRIKLIHGVFVGQFDELGTGAQPFDPAAAVAHLWVLNDQDLGGLAIQLLETHHHGPGLLVLDCREGGREVADCENRWLARASHEEAPKSARTIAEDQNLYSLPLGADRAGNVLYLQKSEMGGHFQRMMPSVY